MRIRKSFVVLTGTSLKDHREWAPSAAEALRLVLSHMKLRRPGVRVEANAGIVSFFQLKEVAKSES